MLCWKLSILFISLVAARPDFREYISGESSEEQGGQQKGSRTTSCPCGWTNKARIVGGKETQANEFPLQIGIMEKGGKKPFCGGSIITNNHILTASHCTRPMQGTQLVIIAGAHNVKDDNQGRTVTIEVESIVEHENYDPRTLEYDIAILVLKTPLQFNQYIGPVCMPASHIDLANEYIKVLGWGMTENRKQHSVSEVLLKVNLRVVDMENCAENFPFQPLDLENQRQICTFRRNKDSCGGDSGGPLIWLDPDTNRYTQVALVSYGRSCAKMTPAVNTDVFYYMEWIKKAIANSGKSGNMCQKV